MKPNFCQCLDPMVGTMNEEGFMPCAVCGLEFLTREQFITRLVAAETVLVNLVALKRLKDSAGKTEEYMDQMPKAWAAAGWYLDFNGVDVK